MIFSLCFLPSADEVLCLSVSLQDYAKTTKQIRKVANGNNSYNFGADPGFVFTFLNIVR